jgi:hypothetical protein
MASWLSVGRQSLVQERLSHAAETEVPTIEYDVTRRLFLGGMAGRDRAWPEGTGQLSEQSAPIEAYKRPYRLCDKRV